MDFQEVAETCYLRLNLVLLAIEARKYEGGEIWINPKNKRVTTNIWYINIVYRIFDMLRNFLQLVLLLVDVNQLLFYFAIFGYSHI